MSINNLTQQILNELQHNVQYIRDDDFAELINQIKNANHIFLAGAGRSGVAIRGFANRLMHLGFSVSLIGDIASPHSQAGDLVIIASGSGETGSLVALAQKAKKSGVKVALITMDEHSTIGKLADCCAWLPGVSPKLKSQGIELNSIQPMGSAFEQLSFLVYDAVILALMKDLQETGDTMFARHADFE